MKNLTKIFVLMLACILLCTNNAWAADPVVSFGSLGTYVTATSNTTMSTFSVNGTGSSTSSFTFNYLQGRTQGSAILLAKSTGAFIANSTPMPGDIKSVTVYINSSASAKTTYHCAFTTTACTSAVTTGSTAVNITGGNSNTYTCSSTGKRYFCVSLGNANNGQVLKLEVTYSSSSSSTTYKVTYNGNGNTGGSVPTDATNYNSGATVTVKANTGSLVKTGYTFSGWNTKADGSGTNYTAGSGTFTISANTTLYAKWTSSTTYTVTFEDDVQNTTCTGHTMSNQAAGTQIVFPSLADKTEATSGTCEQVHYHFAGWIEDGTTPNSTGSNVIAAGTTTINVSKNVTYKAVWAKKQQ